MMRNAHKVKERIFDNFSGTSSLPKCDPHHGIDSGCRCLMERFLLQEACRASGIGSVFVLTTRSRCRTLASSASSGVSSRREWHPRFVQRLRAEMKQAEVELPSWYQTENIMQQWPVTEQFNRNKFWRLFFIWHNEYSPHSLCEFFHKLGYTPFGPYVPRN